MTMIATGKMCSRSGVGDLAHVVGGRRVPGDPVRGGAYRAGHRGHGGPDGRDLVAARRSSPGHRRTGSRRTGRSARPG